MLQIHRVIPGGYCVENDYGAWDVVRTDDPWYSESGWCVQGPQGTLRAWDPVPPLTLLVESGITMTDLEQLGSKWKVNSKGRQTFRRIRGNKVARIYYPSGSWKDYGKTNRKDHP